MQVSAIPLPQSTDRGGNEKAPRLSPNQRSAFY
jgi:hypothetical protein